MSIDTAVFWVNYNEMFHTLHPLECIVDEDKILRCKLTWAEANARPGFISRLIPRLDTEPYKGKIVWFEKGDPYIGSKPFVINFIGVESSVDVVLDLVLIVSGKKTERIEKKWTGKLSQFFGCKVHLMWEEDKQ